MGNDRGHRGWHDAPMGRVAVRRLGAELRSAVARQLRDLPPGRRLRMRLALREVEAHVGTRRDVRLLDAGSEEGLLCLAVARRHPDWLLVAADIAEAPLRRGREWARRESLPVHYVRCDLQRPLGHAVFDVVVTLEALVEIPDDQAALSSLCTALRSGGLLVGQVPAAGWTPVLRSAERTWRRQARHGYDVEDLVARLDRLGMEVQRTELTFRRTVALAQDVRDRWKGRGRGVQLAVLPMMIAAVALERVGLTWGPPRGLLVVAVKR